MIKRDRAPMIASWAPFGLTDSISGVRAVCLPRRRAPAPGGIAGLTREPCSHERPPSGAIPGVQAIMRQFFPFCLSGRASFCR
jgi:hypothetical protein